jgi:preprotein translocase subunit SecG
MSTIQIIGGVILLLVCIIAIIAVTAQESKGGLGAISGESGSYYDKNRGKTKEAMLVRASTIAGVALCVLALLLLFLTKAA